MKVYLVGGAVRDALLGLPVKDEDYVVVGAHAQTLLDQGFIQVGADFPVFLHPKTHHEYALARSERKSGTGYLGFLVDTQNISLEQDLQRRDLTINAMAKDEKGNIIDPTGGLEDLKNRMLRHVGDAFVEDPVRILRLARFWARLGPSWSVAPQTQELAQSMQGALEELTAERVWKEVSKMLCEPHPHLGISFLKNVGAFERKGLAPFVALADAQVPLLQMLKNSDLGLEEVCAFAFAGCTKFESHPIVPKHLIAAKRAYEKLHPDLSAEQWIELMGQCATFKGNLALPQALRAWSVLHPNHPYEQWLQKALQVDVKAISAAMPAGPAVAQAQKEARIAALKSLRRPRFP